MFSSSSNPRWVEFFHQPLNSSSSTNPRWVEFFHQSMNSSSSSNPRWVYDVFINSREGHGNGSSSFVSQLYSALSSARVHTFMNENEGLRKRKEVGKGLTQAIEGSRIALVVFSKTYAESARCLDELVKIMDCHHDYGKTVVPIFYDVDPLDVFEQSGAFGEAFEKLTENRFPGRGMVDLLLRWGSALTHAARLTGWDTRDCRDEADQVKKIVDDVLEKLDNALLSTAKFPVGLESRAQEVIRFINNQSSKVCMVGILGMDGLGKTTLAKAIYNKICRKFESKSFLENIKEVCENNNNRGLIRLQEQLFSCVFKRKIKIDSIELGKKNFRYGILGKRVLMVLDDVTEYEQLKALCGSHERLGLGSVLIVTSKDEHLLDLLKVDHVFKIKEMDENDSLELFSWHAFRKAIPREDFIELSRKVVAYCGGIPLALEVLGSYLYRRTKEEWESVLLKLERIPNDQVQEKFRISFDGLDDKEKCIFLDICCFFMGFDRAYVTEILNDSEFYPKIRIAVLVERNLIKVKKNNKLGMHGLLRDLGREMISECSPKEAEKRSRLWFHEDVLDVMTKHTGTNTIEGLALQLERSQVCFNTKAFEKMVRLRLLKLNHVQLSGDDKYLPQHLRWVYWHGFPLKHLPDSFDQRKVVAIDLKYSNISLLWKEPKLLERLKILNLSHSLYLTHTPDFSNMPNLEKLILKNCPILSMVHESIGDLSNILVINLKDCTSLWNLPRRIYQLTSLKTLILSGCSNIDKLEDTAQMESLTTLIADCVRDIPGSTVRSKRVGYLSLYGYEGLARDVFPSIIWCWTTPTSNPLFHLSQGLSSSLDSMDLQYINVGHIASMLNRLSKLRSVRVQCSSKAQLSRELRILYDLYGVNFTKLETSCGPQVSDFSLRSLLIGLGSYHIVTDTLVKSISQVKDIQYISRYLKLVIAA
ncbi:TMV resistance protein N-like isoform X2 [Abrus precatorius]|uniref:TMV resistance protein N-like isoform X2 n=1 Tax=Abrus precatorius TaxID=3816 RepID=A0A8B8K0D3_ABRPR|nr:TMV resistance protein N-like isoform X2 [Abrus precatorius]